VRCAAIAIARAGHVFRPELFVICCFAIYLRALNFSTGEFTESALRAAKKKCVHYFRNDESLRYG
jgi:hypothetical protein